MRGGLLAVVTAGLLAGGQIVPTNVVAQTNVINIGDAEFLYADSQMPFTMDVSFATLKRDSNTMEFFQTDRGTSLYPLRYLGSLAYPLQTRLANAGWDFSGIYTGGVSGPWLDNIYDNGSGTLIGLIHREDYSGNKGFFAIGLAKSTDGGANWKYLGDILRPYANGSSEFAWSNIGGVPYLIVGDYMYVYFNEHTTTDGAGYKRLAVARALTSDIMAAAASNSVPVFHKYAGGDWTQDGLTGLADNIIPNAVSVHTDHYKSWDFHADAAYCAPLGKYLITVQTHAESKLLLFTSTDGITWGDKTVVEEAPGFMLTYSTFVSLNADASSDCRVVGNEFYLIYPRKNLSNYNVDTLYRRRITIGPVQNTNLVWNPNGNGTDGAGTWSAGNLVWTNPASGAADLAWRNSTNDTAVFGVGNGAAGVVTVSGTLTLGDLTFNSPGSGNYTVSGGTLMLGGNPSVILANADATIDSVLAGASFIKNGRGALTLSGENTFSGDTTINAGTLSLTGGSLSNSSAINVWSGATLTTSVSNTFGSAPTAPWTIAGTITGTAYAQSMPPSVTLNNGRMSGNTFASYGTFLVTGSGTTITASGANNAINAGNVGLAGTLTLNTPNATDALTISSALGASSANSGSLSKTGAGTLTLSGGNTYLGDTTVTAGTLAITGGALASSSSINVLSGATLTASVNNTFGSAPTAPWTIVGTITGTANAQSMPPSVTLNNGTMSGNTFATYGTFLVPSTPTTITANGSNNIISAGNIGLGALLTVNTPNATDALAISSVLGASSVKSHGLTKTGAGTLTLSGANIYTGPTTISDGELIISTVFAGKGNFSVGNGATLAVTNIASSSALASNLTVAAGSALEFHNLSSTNVPLMTASNVIVNGVCTIKIPYATGLDAGKTYPLVRYTGQFNGSFASLQLQLPPGATGTLVNSANQIALAITSVPTPSAPATLTATGGYAQVVLNWSAASFAAGYNVKRSTTSGGGYVTIGTASGPSYADTAVAPGQTYYYVVTAVNSEGESGNSPEVSAILLSPLQAHLKFDEASGTNAPDASGNGWNGTLVNGPAWVAGYSNNAVNLSGASQYVTLPAGVVSNLNDFTICAWVKQTTSSTWSRIFDFGTGTSVNMFLTPQNGANNAIRFAITLNGGAGEQRIDGNAALPTGVWKHVAVTLSGGTGVLYVDGVPVGTNSTMTLKPSSLGTTTQNYLGKSQYNDPYFNGQVDEFRIYPSALTPGEVATFVTPLAAPTGLAATPGDGQVALSWNAVANAVNYQVFRSLINGGPCSQIAVVTATNYLDTPLLNGTNYFYVVNAANTVGPSANSTQVSARPVSTTPPTSSAALVGNQLQLNWPADHTGWRLQMNTNLGTTNWQDVAGTEEANYISIPLTNGNAFFRLVYP